MAINYTDPSVRDAGGTDDWFAQNAPPQDAGGYTQGQPPPYLAPTQAQPAAAPTSRYGAIQGFDTGKLNDTAYSSGKYTPAVRAFSGYLGGGGQIGRNDLGGAVDYAKANGFANATAVGDDKIDFGDGNGPIDVIQSNGSTWFQNGADRFGGGQQPGGMPGGGMQPGMTGGFQSAPTWQGGDYQMPNATDFRNTPGYQAGMDAQQQAIQRSAAAKGTVLNGGTMKALSRYAADYADQGYQQYDQNAFRNYQSRYGQFRDQVGDTRNNNNDYWSRLNDLYSTGAQTAAGSYKPGVTT